MEKRNNVSNFGAKKADAFINISLPKTGGGNQKLGSIPLYEDQWAHKAIIDDPELVNKIFNERVEVNVHIVQEPTGDEKLAL